MREDKLFDLGPLAPNLAEEADLVEGDLGIDLGRADDGPLHDVVPRDLVGEEHHEGRRRRSLLDVGADRDAVHVGSAKEDALDLVPVAVVVDVDRSVGREEGDKVVLTERVGMAAFVVEDHEIRDVDHADSQRRATLAEE